MKRIVLSMLLALGSVAFCMAQEMQEVVYLKNGSIIRGTIIEQVPDKSLKIQTNDGSIFAYEMAEVEKISKEQTTTSLQRKRSAAVQNRNGVQRGYRGFVELGYTVGTSDWDDTNRIEFATSHGYQFNPYFYAGLGIGVHYYHENAEVGIPIFADLRTDILNNWITPYVDLKIGYTVNDGTGFYMSPTVGCRFGFANNRALSLGIGYTMQKIPVLSNKDNRGGFSIKLGVEF